MSWIRNWYGTCLYQKKKVKQFIPFVQFHSVDMYQWLVKKLWLVKIGNTLGVNLDEKKVMLRKYLNNESKYDSIGTVVDKDLYGLDNNELFIT